MISKQLWLVGAGYMAQEYIKVLQRLNIDFLVVGRGEEKLGKLRTGFNVEGIAGSIANCAQYFEVPRYAIVAVSVENLQQVTLNLIEIGVKNILVEKPAGLMLADIDELQKRSSEEDVSLYIAYNRRFYQSVQSAKKMIEMEGGALSVQFEFTEWIHTISTNKFPKEVLSKFLIANSSHVIDTVFFLVGRPRDLNNIVTGDGVSWHPAGSTFVGSGTTERNIPFTYCSNWNAPGRWAIEISTAKHRYYFKPMEKLSLQSLGSVAVNDCDLDYSEDTEFKPGLYQMTKAFLSHDDRSLCKISEHRLNFPFYDRIAGY